MQSSQAQSHITGATVVLLVSIVKNRRRLLPVAQAQPQLLKLLTKRLGFFGPRKPAPPAPGSPRLMLLFPKELLLELQSAPPNGPATRATGGGCDLEVVGVKLAAALFTPG